MNEAVEKIHSIHLGNDRTIWIREPNSPTLARNLTVILDAELYRERVGAPTIIDTLQGQIADSWFVFVSMESPEARWVECPCHRPFAQFVAEELLPRLEARFLGIGSVHHRVIVGLSYTGLAAAFVAKEYPGLFHKVVSQSGSFWWNDCWLVEEFTKTSGRLPTEFYLDVGKREIQENVRHREDVLQVFSQIEGVRRFRDVLLRLGHSVVYAEFEGGHEFDWWRRTLPNALRWALPIDSRRSAV